MRVVNIRSSGTKASVELSFGQGGSGPAVLLLHGLGGSRNDWALQLPPLLRHFRVIAVDLRGHGNSPKPAGPYRMAAMADDVATLLRRINAWPAQVVGLSLGGAVAQQLALDQRTMVRSLVLVNTASRFVVDSWRFRLTGLQRLAAVYRLDMSSVAQSVAQRLFPFEEQSALRRETASRLAANDPAAYRACLWAVARFDVRSELSRIRCPVLVVAGEKDSVLPLKPKQQLACGVANGYLAIIPKSGHATPIDQATRFNDVLLGFLKHVDDADGA